MYIKHNGTYYKQIDLSDLDKKELIKLILEAVEINPTIIDRWTSYPVYIEKYKPYYNQPRSVTYCNALNEDLNNLDHTQLTTLCSTIW